jgi:hypothetical protein
VRRALFLLILCLLNLPAPVHAGDWGGGAYLQLTQPTVLITRGGEYDEGIGYEANNWILPGLELRYKRFGFSTVPPLMGRTSADADRPPTRLFDLNGRYHGRYWGVESRYGFVRGFSASGKGTDEPIDRPSMYLHTGRVNVYKTIDQSSRVYRMSEGIGETGVQPNVYWVYGLSRQLLRADKPFLDTLSWGDTTRFYHMRALSVWGGTVGVSAVVNTRLFGAYCDPGITIAYGLQRRTGNVRVEQFSQQVNAGLRLKAGYAWGRFDAGVTAENEVSTMDLIEESMLFKSLVVRVRLDWTL